MAEPPASPPALRVVTGHPTDEELAALVAVLASRAASAGAREPARPPSAWADPSRLMRPTLHPGPEAWLRSAHPR